MVCLPSPPLSQNCVSYWGNSMGKFSMSRWDDFVSQHAIILFFQWLSHVKIGYTLRGPYWCRKTISGVNIIVNTDLSTIIKTNTTHSFQANLTHVCSGMQGNKKCAPQWHLQCVTCVLLIWLFCIHVCTCVSRVEVRCVCVCVSVALRLSHHDSPLIRPDRCYYIEMRAVMYASVMWTCPLLLDGTWRFSLLWHVWGKNKVPTLCMKCGLWSIMKPHKYISWGHWWKVVHQILKIFQSANKPGVSFI